MADIGAELLEKIRAYFKKKCQDDAYIQSVLGKVAAGTAQMEEISRLSQSIGFRASQAISEYVNVAALPDGKMYYNIADTILSGVLKDNYEIINSASAECQRALDRKIGINIEPQRAPYPAERVQAVAGAASAPDISEEKMVRRMTSTTENITRSFYDDYVETNVKYRSEAGLECFIIRSDHGGCCKWCAALAGKYRYPEEVPKDVYRRHDNCTCTVTYTNGRKAQDVWSKTSRELPAEERERMREIGFKKPTISAEERERMLIAGMKKPQRLDFAGESGIIEDEIRKGNIKLDINHEKQAKHIKGCPEYIDGRSYLTISEDKAQKIINEKSGTGSLVYDRKGLWKNKELIDCDEIIGVDINKSTREETSTDKGTIHYSKSGTHLVPRKEKKHD